ncbi:unnamed protein product [Didymodactylos carnosus]|uniref:C2H2-type domain-containing protein n=3 Tax=Didymodactylos carnosus TaxID=1234261 RepID=A0A814P806_9BILA|nr:unnamed protein product [Didymodactylos carnosus]CAF3866597.1 unnamed protein product [Didymodactylos carnosus]
MTCAICDWKDPLLIIKVTNELPEVLVKVEHDRLDFMMASSTRRSARQPATKAVKFVDPALDGEDEEAMDFEEEPTSNESTFSIKQERFSQQQQKAVRGNQGASASGHNDSTIDDEWTQVQTEEGDADDGQEIDDYAVASTSTSFNNTTTNQSQIADSSVYDFSEVSVKKKNNVNSAWRDVKPQPKANRDTKHMCPYCNYCTGTECGYATVELSKLRRHIRTHTGEKPYTCQYCSYASPDTFKLKRHLRVHTGERPYECTICKFRFTQSNSLKAHMLTHQTNAPKFQCQYCPTILTRKSDLKHHIVKKHQNEHLLYCQQCELDFPNEHSLRKHEQTQHGGQSSGSIYACSMCAFSAPTQNGLEEHMNNTHRDERSFQCNECGLMYATRGDLRQHTTKVHRCGTYANVAGAGLSLRPPTNYIPAKVEHRPITTPRLRQTTKDQQHQIYRCTLCSKTFATLRTLEHHTFDVHNIDPYDNDLQDNEQIAMIQIRGQQHGQNHDHKQPPVIVKLERGALFLFLKLISCLLLFCLDNYNSYELADDHIESSHHRHDQSDYYDNDSSPVAGAGASASHASLQAKSEMFDHDSSSYYNNEQYEEYETKEEEIDIAEPIGIDSIQDDEANIEADDGETIKYRSSGYSQQRMINA